MPSPAPRAILPAFAVTNSLASQPPRWISTFSKRKFTCINTRWTNIYYITCTLIHTTRMREYAHVQSVLRLQFKRDSSIQTNMISYWGGGALKSYQPDPFPEIWPNVRRLLRPIREFLFSAPHPIWRRISFRGLLHLPKFCSNYFPIMFDRC